jgi:hypothetical protein
MAYQQKPQTGSLFKSTDKQNEVDRDYQGSILITEPGKYWLSGWKKTTKGGVTFLSLKAKRKGEATERHVGYMEQPGSRHDTRRLPLPSRDDERTLGGWARPRLCR